MAAAPDAVYLRKLLQKPTEEDGDKKYFIYLFTKVYDDHMEFLMLETRKNATFKAEVTNEKIKSISETLEIPYDDFYKSCCDALTAKNIGMPGFIYEIDREDNMLKLFHKLDFAVRYLEMELKEVTSNHQVLDAAVDLLERQENAAKNSESDRINDAIMYEIMDKAMSSKDLMIKKFTLLLNAKKARILALENQLKEESKDDDSMDAVLVSDNDYATDDDSHKDGGPPAKRFRKDNLDYDFAAEAHSGKECPTPDNDSDDYVSEVLKKIKETEAPNEDDKTKTNAGDTVPIADPVAITEDAATADQVAITQDEATIDPLAVTEDLATADDPVVITEHSATADPVATTQDGATTDPVAITEDSATADPVAIAEDSATTDPVAITQDAATADDVKMATETNGIDEEFQAATEPLTQAVSDE